MMRLAVNKLTTTNSRHPRMTVAAAQRFFSVTTTDFNGTDDADAKTLVISVQDTETGVVTVTMKNTPVNSLSLEM